MVTIEKTVEEAAPDSAGATRPPGSNGVENRIKGAKQARLRIERYSRRAAGYHPFLIRDGWQVAQLNYMPSLRISAIRRMDRHLATDEVFVLIKGTAVLVAAAETPTGLSFVAVQMEPGVTYNIPAGRWHNITMQPGDSVIIVEKSHTHCGDVGYRKLTVSECRKLQATVRKARIGGRK